MRPGRFDRICYCGLPSDEEKLQICEILAAKHHVTTASAAELSQLMQQQQPFGATGAAAAAPASDLRGQLRRLVTQLPRLFTSADINALFSSAKIEAVNEALQDAPPGGLTAAAPGGGPPRVTVMHLYSALVTARASISEADERRYSKVFASYRPGTQPSAMRRNGSDPPPSGVKVALA